MANSDKQVRWLRDQLPGWVANGIIDNAQAGNIRGLYPAESAARPWAMIVFSGMGAVIAGLGVILLFAYNWEDMGKFTKLGIILGSLIIAHATGIQVFLRSERFRALGEAITIMGTMLFGAGIWLIAQIYHIQEHYPNAFLFWSLGALVLCWAMPSIAQAVMSAILLMIWACVEAAEFNGTMYAAPAIMLLLGVMAYRNRSILLLCVLLATFAISTGFIAGAYEGGDGIVLNILLSVVAIYVAAGLVGTCCGGFPESAPVFHFFGFGTYLFLLYMLTFPEGAEEMLEIYITGKLTFSVYGPLSLSLLFVLAAWAMAVRRFIPRPSRTESGDNRYDLLLIPLVVMLCYCCTVFIRDFSRLTLGEWAIAAPFNLVFLAHAGSMMARGCREGKAALTVTGSLLLIVLTAARYADLFESLLIRGMVFIVIGAILFGQGIFYVRSKKKRIEGATP